MNNGHSLLSPSSAERWVNCAGSINLIRTLPKEAFKTSKYAAEGSVAHQLAEDFVTGKLDLLTLTSKVGGSVMHDGYEVAIDDAMVEGVIEYADHITSVKRRLSKPAKVHAEAEVRLIAKSVDAEMWGTTDYLLYQKGNELHVFDFKYGKGVVEAEKNLQGIIYLVGALDSVDWAPFNKLFFHIVQPRARHEDGVVRTWEIEPREMQEWVTRLKVAVVQTQEPKAPRVVGKWCRFCPALAYCDEAREQVESAVGTAFTKIPVPAQKETAATVLPAVVRMTKEELARALDWEEVIDSWFEIVRARAYEELSRDADAVPGYKLVEGRANRQWRDESLVESAFALLGEKRYAPRKLLSPAQMEKVAGKDEVAKYTEKPAGKITVAPASDKREAVRVQKALVEDVFTALTAPAPTKGPQDHAADIFGDLMGGPTPVKREESLWP